MSVPIRLRGPQGISTITVDLDAPVSDLQQAVFAATEVGILNAESEITVPHSSDTHVHRSHRICRIVSQTMSRLDFQTILRAVHQVRTGYPPTPLTVRVIHVRTNHLLVLTDLNSLFQLYRSLRSESNAVTRLSSLQHHARPHHPPTRQSLPPPHLS